MVKKTDPFFVRVCGSANNKTQREKNRPKDTEKKHQAQREKQRERERFDEDPLI
jgi:hypothetical protein